MTRNKNKPTTTENRPWRTV